MSAGDSVPTARLDPAPWLGSVTGHDCRHPRRTRPGTVRLVNGDGGDRGFEPLLAVLGRLDDLDVRLGGGWGVDVLAGQVTRPHHDVDVFVPVGVLDVAAARFADGRFRGGDDVTELADHSRSRRRAANRPQRHLVSPGRTRGADG